MEAESDRKAVIRVKQTLDIEWPNWWKINIDLNQMEEKIINGALDELRGPWILTCAKCGASATRDLTSFEIENLIRDRAVRVDCPNPQCGFAFSHEDRAGHQGLDSDETGDSVTVLVIGASQ